MINKVTSIRADDPMPGKVIAVGIGGGDAMLAKLAGTLSTVMEERCKNLSTANAATEILRQPPPSRFDEEASGRAVAQARVHDLVAGASTAEGVAAGFDKQRIATEEAIATHERRQAEARQQLATANSFLKALTSQALELDKAVRTAIAALAVDKADEAGEAFSKSVICYMEEFINFRALRWLRTVQGFGDKLKQFSPAEDEMDLRLAVPKEFLDLLPEGWAHSEIPGEVTYKRYEVRQMVQKRGIEIMEKNSNGLFPNVGADLARAAGETQAN